MRAAKSIDSYVEQRCTPDAPPPDARLVAVVERMFERCARAGSVAGPEAGGSSLPPPGRCFADGQFNQAVGIALESRRLDKLEEAVARSGDAPACLAYALRVSQALVTRRDFRRTARGASTCPNSADGRAAGAAAACEAVHRAGRGHRPRRRLPLPLPAGRRARGGGDAGGADRGQRGARAAPLCLPLYSPLTRRAQEDALTALQISFDLFDNDAPEFVLSVAGALQAEAPEATAPPAPAAPAGGGDAMDTGEAAAAADAPAAAGVPAAVAAPPPSPAHARRAQLRRVLSGDAPVALGLDFLSSRNSADVGVLKSLKAGVEARNAACHAAVVLANAVAHCGTTCDTFLRDNLEWLGRATNWAKFAATAGLGVIHRGHTQQGRALMAPYLPRDGGGGGGGGSVYSEGGALFALGLIHAQHGAPIRPFLATSLRAATSEVVQHGACLGVGLAAIATGDDATFDDLKAVLYADSAVAGEAAGLAMGLLLAGRAASDKAGEMLAYAHDTQHEKIIRGLAVGLALSCCGREEEAEPLVQALQRDADPVLRYGGCFAVGLAYRCTAHNGAVRQLLHAAVSDVSDDVRRAAVLALGFVLCGSGDACPKLVALLAESYNPHVRYGAAMAVGIACGGTGSKEAMALLDPLCSDGVDFVRQGAYIATALVLQATPEAPRVAAFRKALDKAVADKHEEPLAKMGAIIAAGLLDAGGRNAVVSLRSRSGAARLSSHLGVALFCQHWYWHPLGACISLALHPAAAICVTSDLALPDMGFTSLSKPSTFATPPPLASVSSAPAAKLSTAVLSTTAKAKAKAAKKAAAEKAAAGAAGAGGAAGGGGGVVTPSATSSATPMDEGENALPSPDAAAPTTPGAPGDAKATDGGDGEGGSGGAPKEEPLTLLRNPARVVPTQEKLIHFDDKARYVPVKSGVGAGVLVVRDTQPQLEPAILRRPVPLPPPPPAPPAAPEEEAAPPAPFVFDPDA